MYQTFVRNCDHGCVHFGRLTNEDVRTKVGDDQESAKIDDGVDTGTTNSSKHVVGSLTNHSHGRLVSGNSVTTGLGDGQLGFLGYWGETGGGVNQAATAMISQVDEQFGINAMGVGPAYFFC